MRQSTTFERAAETPVSWVILIAYVTIAVLTFPDTEQALEWQQRLWLRPYLVSDGEPWRLCSYAFVHGGFLHLLLNSMAHLWIGPGLELALGSARFLLLYVISAIGGGLCIALVNDPFQIVVGGSGALFGLMGAAVALHSRAGDSALDFMSHHGARRLFGLILVNLAFGFVIPVVSNAGHIGGLLAGSAFTLTWIRFGRWQPRWSLRIAVLAAMLGFTAQSIWPVTRWDWLVFTAQRQEDPDRQRQLERAAAQAAGAPFPLIERVLEQGDQRNR
jgi:membrane associated rhomboid family serine protease